MALTEIPIELSSTPSIVDGGNATAITIDSSENVGIGTGSPATQLFVKSASNAANVFAVESANAAQRLQIGVNTSNGGSYIFEQKAQALRFGTSDTERMIIDSSGRVTIPNQPAFQVRPSSQQDNIAVAANTTVVFGQEITDRGSNFASNTFTAPVTGLYQLNVTIYFFGAQEAMNYIQMNLQTSNNVNYAVTSTSAYENDAPYLTIGHSVLADMDANDTAFVQVQTGSGGSATTDITVNSQFSGYLVA